MAGGITNLSDADELALLNVMIAIISGDLPGYPGVTTAMVTESAR
ncbi:MAG TPA: hypothetical protein VJ023_09815 [Pyrinomonadaceae bacterium]|nr:hypothetical protein [Pyrinomonadaceae bacterium]